MARRIVALFLTVAILLTFNIAAFASGEPIGNSSEARRTEFVDAEGKTNTVYVSSQKRGSAHVDYYIDSTLINSVDVDILGDVDNTSTTLSDNTNIHIKYTNMRTMETQELVSTLNQYVLPISVQTVAHPTSANAYNYQGKILYKTHYDSFGNAYNDSLSIYRETIGTTYEYKTINAAAGDIASIVIGAIAAVLTIICPGLEVFSSDLLYAAAYAVGTSIIGGIVQGAITKQYYTRKTTFNVKACDTSTSREVIYDAEQYQLALTGGGYSDYYYEGYLPWDTNAVAYWMFCDFWSYTYPGVSSYITGGR